METEDLHNGTFLFGSKGEKVIITATCMGVKASMTLVYLRAEIFAVQFNRAHKNFADNILTNEETRHDLPGVLFNDPYRGWKSENGSVTLNLPVAHTFGDDVLLDLKVVITPAGLPFTIEGSGLEADGGGEIKWKKVSPTPSSGMEESILIPPVDGTKLPQSVGISIGSIQWTVTATCCPNDGEFTVKTIPESSGEHEIFRTFGEPNAQKDPDQGPAEPSLRRMRTVCEFAEGAITHEDAVSKLVEKWPYLPMGADFDAHKFEDDWRIFEGISGDCDDHSTAFAEGCLLLGIPAIMKEIHASKPDNKCLTWDTKTLPVDGVDVECMLYFGNAGGAFGDKATDFGGANYQGVALVEGVYWNIYIEKDERICRPTSCAMYNYLVDPVVGIFKAQYWVYKKLGINYIHTPEPFPDPFEGNE